MNGVAPNIAVSPEEGDAFARYARQSALRGFSKASAERLRRARVVVFGAGGVGSALLPLLAGAGVGHITIVDGDTVSLSNLHRQTLYAESDIGRPKAPAAAARLRALNAQIRAEPVACFIRTVATAARMMRGADLCIDATDTFLARSLISRASARAEVRHIAATAGGFASQMFLLGAGRTFDAIAPEASRDRLRGLPIFGPAAHLSGVWAAGFAVAILAGARAFEPGYFQRYDFLDGRFFRGILAGTGR